MSENTKPSGGAGAAKGATLCCEYCGKQYERGWNPFYCSYECAFNPEACKEILAIYGLPIPKGEVKP